MFEAMNAASAASTEERFGPKPILRIDKSKTFSTVHGDRTPEDPHYKVHFWQDGLPFDVNGMLVQDDGRVQEFSGADAESKPVRYKPLYDAKMRAKLEKKLLRLNKVARAPEPEEIEADAEHEDASPELKAAMAESVNLESWLRGEVDYEPWMIFSAYKARYHHQTHKISEVVLNLVEDEKIVRPEQVTKHLQRYLPVPSQTA